MENTGDKDEPQKPRKQTIRGSITVGLVLVLCGVLFVANIRSQPEDSTRGPSDLAELLAAESERVAAREQVVEELRAEVDELTEKSHEVDTSFDLESAERLAYAAGGVDVEGPGVKITMSDASVESEELEDVRADDLVVHQQDLESVINALWAGGAEAMAIQGQRVISTSAVRCVGNTLMLHGQLYSPPYYIEAIGPQEEMLASVAGDPGVQLYLQYVDMVGLGWSEEKVDWLEFSTYDSNISQADVPDDVDVLDLIEHEEGSIEPDVSVPDDT